MLGSLFFRIGWILVVFQDSGKHFMIRLRYCWKVLRAIVAVAEFDSTVLSLVIAVIGELVRILSQKLISKGLWMVPWILAGRTAETEEKSGDEAEHDSCTIPVEGEAIKTRTFRICSSEISMEFNFPMKSFISFHSSLTTWYLNEVVKYKIRTYKTLSHYFSMV